MTPSATMFMLGAVVFAVWIISAMLLRVSCFFNSVRGPRFVGAALLMLIVIGATVLMHAGLSMGMGMSAPGMNMTPESAGRLVLILALPFHMLVAATAYRIMLPTTFGRAMSVWFVQAMALAVLVVGFNKMMTAIVPQGWEQMRVMMGV